MKKQKEDNVGQFVTREEFKKFERKYKDQVIIIDIMQEHLILLQEKLDRHGKAIGQLQEGYAKKLEGYAKKLKGENAALEIKNKRLNNVFQLVKK